MQNQNELRWNEPFNPVSDLYHFGIKNMKWGINRFQLPDGTWTEEGLARRREREGFGDGERTADGRRSKEDIVNSGNVKLVAKYRRELTTDELRTAINRIDTERKLDSLLKDANKSLWQRRMEATMKVLGSAGKMADDLITWGTRGNGKLLLDTLSGKAANDKEITRRIKNGDYDWLKANFSNMSVTQQKAAVDALGVRWRFDTKQWKKSKKKDNDQTP